MLAYDRSAVVKQIAVAKAERDAFVRQHRNVPTRRCTRCHEVWELLPKRFPTYKWAAGVRLYRKTCRFCLRTAARLKEREKKLLLGIPTAILDYELSAKKSRKKGRGLVARGHKVMAARHL
jgi:hypothetical protein